MLDNLIDTIETEEPEKSFLWMDVFLTSIRPQMILKGLKEIYLTASHR